MTPKIAIPYDKIAEFCKKNHIKKLSLFGSVLRDDFTENSDVDVLVEFEEGKTPGFAFFGMDEELSEILGRKVDFNTEGFLSEYIVDKVKREAMTLYDRS
jgi:predicted nucleotidyltransferase